MAEEPAFPADPGDAWLAVRDALLAEYAERYELLETELDAETLALAERLAGA